MPAPGNQRASEPSSVDGPRHVVAIAWSPGSGRIEWKLNFDPWSCSSRTSLEPANRWDPIGRHRPNLAPVDWLYRDGVQSPWRFWTSAAVLAGASFAYFASAAAEQAARATLADNPIEATEQAGFIGEMYAIAVLSVIGLLAFLVIRSTWGWLLAAGVQVGVFVFALIQGALTIRDDIGWLFFSAIPLMTILLLAATRALRPRPEPADRERLEPTLTS